MAQAELHQNAALSAFHVGEESHHASAGCCATHFVMVVGMLRVLCWSHEVGSGALSGGGG